MTCVIISSTCLEMYKTRTVDCRHFLPLNKYKSGYQRQTYARKRKTVSYAHLTFQILWNMISMFRWFNCLRIKKTKKRTPSNNLRIVRNLLDIEYLLNIIADFLRCGM